MKRYLLLPMLFVACSMWAQPSFRQADEGPKREDFPQKQEIDNTPINATFSFALLSDLHICDTLPQNNEDLQRAIDEINQRPDLAFVLVSGDLTHNGDTKSLQLTKELLGNLNVPYYVVPGNHDTRMSESAAVDFGRIFGDTRFRLFFNDYLFLGLNTAPLLRHNDAHVSPQDLDWLSFHLRKAGRKQPVFAIVHHPLKSGDVDNWEAVTDILREYNILGVLCGHYHRNAVLDFDGIQGVVLRSTLRGSDSVGGYTVFDMADSLYISEKQIGKSPQRWYALPIAPRVYTASDEKLFPRPNFDINKEYKQVKIGWKKQLKSGIYGNVAIDGNLAFVGDDAGFMRCFDVAKGKQIWQYKTPNRIAAAPTVSRGKVIFGSGDNNIYALSVSDGKLLWKLPTKQAVCATPTLVDDVACVGSGDGQMRAINIESGLEIWNFAETQGYIQNAATICDNKLIFGAFDKTIYALDLQLGDKIWSCALPANPLTQPIFASGKVFVVTADKQLFAIDVASGQIVWNEKSERFIASLGVSADGKTVFARTKDGKVFALDATINSFSSRWKIEGLYADDVNPCTMTENAGTLVFVTKNGLIVGLDATNGAILWQHKIGNTGVNALIPVAENSWLLTTLDGIVARLNVKLKK